MIGHPTRRGRGEVLRVNVEKAGKWRKGRRGWRWERKEGDVRRREHMLFDSSSPVDAL